MDKRVLVHESLLDRLGAALARRLEAGTVWVNCHGGAAAEIPFGGFKESGVGRGMGLIGLKSYAEARVLHFPPGA